ncbi:MAG: hypothetical protein KA998_05360 [Rickettsiaceae bacterium]|nr:hypothetical protein [Rickettsiaceae bacterium]
MTKKRERAYSEPDTAENKKNKNDPHSHSSSELNAVDKDPAVKDLSNCVQDMEISGEHYGHFIEIEGKC